MSKRDVYLSEREGLLRAYDNRVKEADDLRERIAQLERERDIAIKKEWAATSAMTKMVEERDEDRAAIRALKEFAERRMCDCRWQRLGESTHHIDCSWQKWTTTSGHAATIQQAMKPRSSESEGR